MDIKSQRELTLVDWGWVSGALILLVLICSCIVLLARGANQLATTQAQGIPLAASLRPLTESNREAHTQSVTVVTPQEFRHSGFVSASAQSSIEVHDPPKWTQSHSTTDKFATANLRSAKAIQEETAKARIKTKITGCQQMRRPRRLAAKADVEGFAVCDKSRLLPLIAAPLPLPLFPMGQPEISIGVREAGFDYHLFKP